MDMLLDEVSEKVDTFKDKIWSLVEKLAEKI